MDLRGRAGWQQQRGLSADWLEPEDLARLEPALAGAAGSRLVGALWLPDEAQVRSPRLVRALATAAIRRGATFQEGTPVLAIETQSGRVTGVRTLHGPVSAKRVVLAAGAWSGPLAETGGLAVPVEPIKGQIVALGSLMQPPRHILWSGECYVAPKVDGELVVGATEEHAGFDSRPTLSGMLQLATGATDMLPALGRLPILSQWGGLRPATPDRHPVIGAAPVVAGLYVATAHFRNGVLLGPLTGRLVADLLQGRPPSFDVTPYAPDRFV